MQHTALKPSNRNLIDSISITYLYMSSCTYQKFLFYAYLRHIHLKTLSEHSNFSIPEYECHEKQSFSIN